jgi:competence protein ComEC
MPVVNVTGPGSISLDPDVEIAILAPSHLDQNEMNNNSIVLRVTYRNTSFLFMGDAETSVENEISTQAGFKTADVIKNGHHGSTSSSGSVFLKKVSPKIAVITVGRDNDYGHPAKTVLDRLTALQTQILRTDLQGTIVLSSDGNSVTVD